MIAGIAPEIPPTSESKGDPLEYVSPSRLKSYLTCPLRFFFEKVLQITKPVSPALFLGRTVHSALQAYNKARWRNQDHSEATILASYYEGFDNETEQDSIEWKSTQKRDEIKARGAAVVAAFLRSGVHPPEEKPAGVEVMLQATRPDLPLPLLGIVDLVKADWTPVDYKTVASTPVLELECWLHELQLVAYALLVEDSTDQPIPGCELVFLVKTKSPKVIVRRLSPPDKTQIARFRSLVSAYASGIERGNFHPRPGQHCAWCPYRIECSGWKGETP